jgi:hypothetical protein
VVSFFIAGFALAFYWKDKINTEIDDSRIGGQFTSVFMNAFGDFGMVYDDMTIIDSFLFFSGSFLICLIMMNLFIGILSEKLATVLEERAEPRNEYAELCDLVYSVELLIKYDRED